MNKSNVRGGKSHKRFKKHRPDEVTVQPQLQLCDKGQVYALVKSRNGGSRLQVECSDGISRSAIIPGKFYKKVWFNQYDLTLCDLNIGGDDKQCYVVHKYTIKDAVKLKNLGKVTFEAISTLVSTVDEDEDGETKKDIKDMFPQSDDEEESSKSDGPPEPNSESNSSDSDEFDIKRL